MSTEELIQKLSRLSEREREVLELRCEGLEYAPIAEQLILGESTIKTYMGRVYVKLELDLLPEIERTKALYEEFCPALRDLEVEPTAEDLDEPEPVPLKVARMVEEDEKTLVPWRSSDQIVLVPESEMPTRRRSRPLRLLMIGMLLGMLVTVALFIGLGRQEPERELPVGQEPEAPVAGDDEPEVAALATITPLPEAVVQTQIVVVTATSLPATPTSPPTSTLPPTAVPAPTVLFSDNFDEGFSDSWTIRSGQPFIVNGQLTASEDTWLMIGDSSWTDYSVEFDLVDPAQNIFSWGFNVIGVRATDLDNMIALRFARQDTDWSIVSGGNWNEIPNSEGQGIRSNRRVRVVVEGDQISGFVEIDLVFSSVNQTYPQGGVVFKLESNAIFDNFIVRAIEN